MHFHHKVEFFSFKKKNKQISESTCLSVCLSQVPEDEETIPPVLEYNNHMIHKHQEMWAHSTGRHAEVDFFFFPGELLFDQMFFFLSQIWVQLLRGAKLEPLTTLMKIRNNCDKLHVCEGIAFCFFLRKKSSMSEGGTCNNKPVFASLNNLKLKLFFFFLIGTARKFMIMKMLHHPNGSFSESINSSY